VDLRFTTTAASACGNNAGTLANTAANTAIATIDFVLVIKV